MLVDGVSAEFISVSSYWSATSHLFQTFAHCPSLGFELEVANKQYRDSSKTSFEPDIQYAVHLS
jgi:hypothetical protein